jgi:hypothetical protein
VEADNEPKEVVQKENEEKEIAVTSLSESYGESLPKNSFY